VSFDYESEVARCDAEIAKYSSAAAGVPDYLMLMGLADWHAERAWLLRQWAR
jgi:hypothetical protein